VFGNEMQLLWSCKQIVYLACMSTDFFRVVFHHVRRAGYSYEIGITEANFVLTRKARARQDLFYYNLLVA